MCIDARALNKIPQEGTPCMCIDARALKKIIHCWYTEGHLEAELCLVRNDDVEDSIGTKPGPPSLTGPPPITYPLATPPEAPALTARIEVKLPVVWLGRKPDPPEAGRAMNPPPDDGRTPVFPAPRPYIARAPAWANAAETLPLAPLGGKREERPPIIGPPICLVASVEIRCRRAADPGCLLPAPTWPPFVPPAPLFHPARRPTAVATTEPRIAGGGFARANVFSHAGIWRAATVGSKVRAQCGHGTKCDGPDEGSGSGL